MREVGVGPGHVSTLPVSEWRATSLDYSYRVTELRDIMNIIIIITRKKDGKWNSYKLVGMAKVEEGGFMMRRHHHYHQWLTIFMEKNIKNMWCGIRNLLRYVIYHHTHTHIERVLVVIYRPRIYSEFS